VDAAAVALSVDGLEIGREPRDGLALDDHTASRRHAEIRFVRSDDGFEVRDRGSKNGTWVNGRRIDRARLESGAVLRIGAHLFVFEELRLPQRVDLSASPAVSLARAWVEHQVDRAAASDLPILVQGPTGAGKERLAQRVHRGSGRGGGLVAVNCATLNRELLGSELFGHVKGAFSDARADRAGLVASADGGTLFLDEIADLPLDQQPALLRVLQEQRLRPVGSDRELTVDVRVVAATHRDLEAAQAGGSFRADLYARLAGLVVTLPGLRERRVEVLALLRELAPRLRLSLEAAEALLLYDWPRNVRELRHLAKRLELLAADPVELSQLPQPIQSPPAADAEVDSLGATVGRRPERDELEQLLRDHAGKVAGVARTLGLTRQSVYRLLEEHGLVAAEFRRGKG
jgi:DNA-binding NtrC family response regulator